MPSGYAYYPQPEYVYYQAPSWQPRPRQRPVYYYQDPNWAPRPRQRPRPRQPQSLNLDNDSPTRFFQYYNSKGNDVQSYSQLLVTRKKVDVLLKGGGNSL